MVNDVKQLLDNSGIKVAGWIVTSTIVIVGVAFLYTKYIESQKLRVDYLISQYELYKRAKENPDFTPVKSDLKDQLNKFKKENNL